jgi:hypothetical protein
MAQLIMISVLLLSLYFVAINCEHQHALKFASIDWKVLKKDIQTFFTTSDSSWPSDSGNYAPFMIRHAWHCAGSYRANDGRGWLVFSLNNIFFTKYISNIIKVDVMEEDNDLTPNVHGWITQI